MDVRVYSSGGWEKLVDGDMVVDAVVDARVEVVEEY